MEWQCRVWDKGTDGVVVCVRVSVCVCTRREGETPPIRLSFLHHIHTHCCVERHMQTSTSAHEAHTSANIRRRASTPSGPIGASASTAPSTALGAAATVRPPPNDVTSPEFMMPKRLVPRIPNHSAHLDAPLSTSPLISPLAPLAFLFDPSIRPLTLSKPRCSGPMPIHLYHARHCLAIG